MHNTQQTNIHTFSVIRTRDPQQLNSRRPTLYTTRSTSFGYPNSKYLSISKKLNVIIASQCVLFTTQDSSVIRLFMIL
jgi:hypothetical protein